MCSDTGKPHPDFVKVETFLLSFLFTLTYLDYSLAKSACLPLKSTGEVVVVGSVVFWLSSSSWTQIMSDVDRGSQVLRENAVSWARGRPVEAEALGIRLQNLCFSEFLSDPWAHYSLKA